MDLPDGMWGWKKKENKNEILWRTLPEACPV